MMMMSKNDVCDIVNGLKPTAVMVVVQFAFAGVNLFYKVAASQGMSAPVIVAYRFLFATLFMLPLALFLERKRRPKLTWTVLFQAFLCGLFGGSLSQNLYVESLNLTSVTFACAVGNLGPAITFVLAITLGLEKVGLATMAGKAKVVGTMVGIGGAMVLTFYKGQEVKFLSTNVDLLSNIQVHGPRPGPRPGPGPNTHVLGSLLALISCFCFALWLIIQAKMSKEYPCPYTSTTLMSLMGTLQAFAFALFVERDWNQWRLGWNLRLLTVAYMGIVGSGLMITLIAWCVRIKGPLFVSIFSPLILVLVALVGSLLLDEKLYLGSLLGAALVVCGLYAVLWGKSKEDQVNKMAELINPPTTPPGEGETIENATQNDNNTSTKDELIP